MGPLHHKSQATAELLASRSQHDLSPPSPTDYRGGSSIQVGLWRDKSSKSSLNCAPQQLGVGDDGLHSFFTTERRRAQRKRSLWFLPEVSRCPTLVVARCSLMSNALPAPATNLVVLRVVLCMEQQSCCERSSASNRLLRTKFLGCHLSRRNRHYTTVLHTATVRHQRSIAFLGLENPLYASCLGFDIQDQPLGTLPLECQLLMSL